MERSDIWCLVPNTRGECFFQLISIGVSITADVVPVVVSGPKFFGPPARQTKVKTVCFEHKPDMQLPDKCTVRQKLHSGQTRFAYRMRNEFGDNFEEVLILRTMLDDIGHWILRLWSTTHFMKTMLFAHR